MAWLSWSSAASPVGAGAFSPAASRLQESASSKGNTSISSLIFIFAGYLVQK
jgi:hypothetical protein